MSAAIYGSLGGSGDRVTGGIVDEPLDDARHVLLEVSGMREVQDTGGSGTSVLEVVRDSGGNQDERSLRRVDPVISDEDGHGSFELAQS